MTERTILLTGGAGYIGSHTYVALKTAGWTPVIVDNFCNSSRDVIIALGKLTDANPIFYDLDIRDTDAITDILKHYDIDAVMHFAALKAVGESVKHPLPYYANNIGGMISLLAAMKTTNARTIVYSSSAAVYGTPNQQDLIDESAPMAPVHPYGATKAIGEDMLRDLCAADPQFNATALRYFNPVGAHDSGLIGENPAGVPNNLMPYLVQVAAGQRKTLTIHGTDYETPDGTCIRDFVHVMDVADAHVKALDYLQSQPGLTICNLGTGRGTSVRELITCFETTNGLKLPVIHGPRRTGDVMRLCANPARAENILKWRAQRDLKTMCRDSWKWQKNQTRGTV
jgi:UDP-glucose 4-epimerase